MPWHKKIIKIKKPINELYSAMNFIYDPQNGNKFHFKVNISKYLFPLPNNFYIRLIFKTH